MDEELREAYNRFGEAALQFDPRKDELKLMTDIGLVYIFWIFCGYLFTLPVASQASRTWMVILGIALFAVEIAFSLFAMNIPDLGAGVAPSNDSMILTTWLPVTLTEYELIFYLHSTFPFILALLRLLAQWLYVDRDETSIAVLKQICSHQKVSE